MNDQILANPADVDNVTEAAVPQSADEAIEARAEAILALPEGSQRLLTALAREIDTDNTEIAKRFLEIRASIAGLERWLDDRDALWKHIRQDAPKQYTKKGVLHSTGTAGAIAHQRIKLLLDLRNELEAVIEIELDPALGGGEEGLTP
jgi:hypothetical protein